MLSNLTLSITLVSVLLLQPATAPSQDVPPLQPPAVQAMLDLLDKERESLATYQAVLAEHRPLPPFGRIVRDEASHEQQLMAQLERYGIAVPANTWAKKAIDAPDDADAARQLGVTLERETIAAYQKAIRGVSDENLKSELLRLRVESRQHLRMFQNGCCGAGAGGGSGAGRGAGPGAGAGGGTGRGTGPGAGRR